jgi:hypothetical protein
VAVTLRFHGRFIYSRKASGGPLKVIAPTFPPPKKDGDPVFNRHDTLMTVPLNDVLFTTKLAQNVPLTTLQPKFRVASHTDPAHPQIVVWDVGGLHVSYEADGKLDIPSQPGFEILSLSKLESVRDPKAHAKVDGMLSVGDGRTNGVIEVSAGAATFGGGAGQVTFVRLADVKGGGALQDVNDPAATQATPLTATPAELATFAVTPPPAITATADTFLVLRFADASGLRMVTVRDGATVSFSNLCAPFVAPTLPRTDLEFGRFYDLLAEPPGDDRLIPHDGTGGSESACCVCAAQD